MSKSIVPFLSPITYHPLSLRDSSGVTQGPPSWPPHTTLGRNTSSSPSRATILLSSQISPRLFMGSCRLARCASLAETLPISVGPQSLPSSRLVRHSAASLEGLLIRYIMHAPPSGKPTISPQLNVRIQQFNLQSVGLFAAQKGLSSSHGTSFLRLSTRQLLNLTPKLLVLGTSVRGTS